MRITDFPKQKQELTQQAVTLLVNRFKEHWPNAWPAEELAGFFVFLMFAEGQLLRGRELLCRWGVIEGNDVARPRTGANVKTLARRASRTTLAYGEADCKNRIRRTLWPGPAGCPQR